MEQNELEVLLHFHNDTRALIAAGKVQRWEVVKWTVTVNVALAAASSASGALADVRFLIFCFALAISVFGFFLLLHYNQRMTRARLRMTNFNTHIQQNVLDVDTISGGTSFGKKKDINYDWQEMQIFGSAICLSVIPALAAWLA